MHRFFVLELAESAAAGDLIGRRILLPDRIAHQIRDVLHLTVGEQVALLDNSGKEYICNVIKSDRMSVGVEVVGQQEGKPESPVRIILCQGLLKSARFEWILEKGTELGVATFAPTIFRRSLSGLEDAGEAKIQRWQRILQEAAEQCGRSRLPELLPIQSFEVGLNSIPSGASAFIPWEEEHQTSLREGLQTVSVSGPEHACTVVLFIGPEGGLTAEEVLQAQRHRVQPVSLGPRILRAETAAIAAVADTMYQLEE